MSMKLDKVKVLEQCQISPPPDSVPNTSLPFTFLDIHWLNCCPIQRVFFYQAPFSASQFREEVLPNLKNSLSLALQRFFPFCGNCVLPPDPEEPYILYTDGDSVPFLVAQSTCAFSDFIKDEPKQAKDIHPLVPPTPPTRVMDDTPVKITPLIAIQVTLFPNTGLCIGFKYRHMVADGMSSMHFIKTWASIFKAKCNMSEVIISLPVLDKSVIKDPDGIKDIALKQWRARGSPMWKETGTLSEDSVRVTFMLSRSEIELLKKWISTKYDKGTESTPKLHLSSYVVTCAFIWACLIKSLNAVDADDSSKDQELCHFVIVADCRNIYDLGIPMTYFGNSITGRLVSVARGKFREEDCVITAAEAISRGVQSFKDGPLDRYVDMLLKVPKLFGSGENILVVAGSPKLAEYDTDFGWGRPEKVEVVHIDISGSISLSESKSEKGGIEVGICRSRHLIDVFTSFFQSGIKQLSEDKMV